MTKGVGGRGLFSGGGVPPLPNLSPPMNWRSAITDAYDSGADASLRSALIGSETSKARPSYTIAAGQTRTIAVKTGAISAPGAFLSYVPSLSAYTIVAEESFDSTDGNNGSWTSIPADRVFPSGGGAAFKRQVVRLSAGPSRWMRYAINNVETSTISISSVMLHQRQSGFQDAWMVIGASLENYGCRSLDMEASFRARFPDRDPVIFNYSLVGQTVSVISSWRSDIVSRLGDLFSYVILGNVIGNDISNNQPIDDDTPATLDAMRSNLNSLLTGFPSKRVFAARQTYRTYGGLGTGGAVPYNEQIVDTAVLANQPEAYSSMQSMAYLDEYCAAMFNRRKLTDSVHFGTFDGSGYGWKRDEEARMCGGRVYNGAWPVSFAEMLVADAEVTKSIGEASYAVTSLPASAHKTALQARLAAIPALRKTKVRLGTSTAPDTPWTWRSTAASSSGTVLSALLDENGASTSYSLTLVDGGTGVSTVGVLGSSDSDFPPDVTFNALSDTSSSIIAKFSGLIDGKSYAVKVMCSRSGVTGRNCNVTVNGVTKTIDVGGNITPLTFENVIPVSGEITVTVARGTGNSTAAYLSGLQLSEAS